MSGILKVKDKDRNWIDINVIKGEDGKSAYEQAKEGGYTGTEEEFIALLNGITSPEYTSIKTGTYTGGKESSVTDFYVSLTIGFKPRAVIIASNGQFLTYTLTGSDLIPTIIGGVFVDGDSVVGNNLLEGKPMVFDEHGFSVKNTSGSFKLNLKGTVYSYIAFR